jgi:dolichol-phosphate mannosyltransferase
MRLLTIIPTYNEIENIESFIKVVFSNIPTDAEILVIDDNSPDGTAQVVEKIKVDFPGRLHILKRPGKQGVASAFLEGFSWGMEQGFDILLAMDADFSHDPMYIPLMLKEIETADLVIGSRNVPGGGIKNRTFIRDILTKGGALYCQLLLNCPIKDFTGGYNMWRKTTLEKIGLGSVFSRGYSFQIEMKYKSFMNKCRIIEIPIIFQNRAKGQSKMSGSFLLKALLDVWKIRFNNIRGFAEFFKFAVTGGLGTITNLAAFFLCADVLGLHEIPVSIGCFMIAGTQNYVINHFWSFKKASANSAPSVKKWALFLLVSLFGLGLNLLVLKAVLTYINPPYKVIAQACGIAAGMIVNFVLSKNIVFGRKKFE